MVELHYKNKKIIAIADTHGRHRNLDIPQTDFLIHCGDACDNGDIEQLNDFFKWFSQQPAYRKIFIAGNHDLPFHSYSEQALNLVPEEVIFLENQYRIIDGLSFCSIPARPKLYIQPVAVQNLDFLLTHGPCHSLLDFDEGCPELLKFVLNVKPVYHLFGHIHQMAQTKMTNGMTHFYNLSIEGSIDF